MTASAYKNGEQIASDFLDDRGFAYADGFFETMSIVGKSIPLQHYHIERALRSARALKIPLSKARLESELAGCLSKLDSKSTAVSIYKMLITRGLGGSGGYPPVDVETNLYSILKPYLRTPKTAVALSTVKDRLPLRASFCGLKLLNRLDYSVAAQGHILPPGTEALFLNQNETLVETMHHNVFFISKGKLCTPSLDGFGVRGVMRAVIIDEIAPKLGLTVESGEYALPPFLRSEGAFITNAIDGIVEVTCVDGDDLSRSALVTDIAQRVNELFSI